MATDPTPNAGATGVTGIRPIQTLAAPPEANYPPEQLKAMREYSKYLMSGGGQQPVKHWTQGVSNMVSALLGGSMDRLAAQRENAAYDYQHALDPRPIGAQGVQPVAPPGTAAPPAQTGAAPQAVTGAGQPALGFTETASRGSDKAGSGGLDAGGAVKGSYFGNYKGKYNWVDKMDSGKQAGGQAVQDAPGIALPSRKTLGKLFDVTTPDGRVFTAKQTDLGPARWTKRGVDVNSALAEQMGYTPDRYKGPGRNPFPTDKHFAVRPHVEGQGDQRLLVQGGEGGAGAGGAGDGLAGRALAFNGDPISQLFAPMIASRGGGAQAPQAAGAQGGGDQAPQAAGGQDPNMVTALSGGRGGGVNASPATLPPGAAPGPGLVPLRPQISREDYIHSRPWYRTPEQQQYFDNAYRMQNMPVVVPGTGGNWIFPAQGGQPQWVGELQTRTMGGAQFPYVTMPQQGGGYGIKNLPIERRGGAPVQPAPPQTTDKPIPLIPPKKPVGPQGALPDAAGSTVGYGPTDEVGAKYAAAGVPSEITEGPKGAAQAPQSMLTNAPPTAAPSGSPQPPAQQGGGRVAQFGGQPQVPTQPAGGLEPEEMTPGEYFRWQQQQGIDTKAAEGYQAADTKGFFDKFEGYQTQAVQAQNLENQIQYAQQLAKDYQLRLGPGSQWLTSMDKFLSFFGDKDATQRVTLADTFTKLTSGTILADMKSKLEGLGQVRLAEIDLLRKAAQAQSNTLGANLAILDMADRLQKQLQQVGTITRLYKEGVRWNQDGSVRVDKNGNPIIDSSKPTQEGMAGVIKMYLSNNPLYKEGEIAREIAEIKAAPQQAGPPPKAGAEPAAPKTPSVQERDQKLRDSVQRRIEQLEQKQRLQGP